jgi:hypothetical protein
MSRLANSARLRAKHSTGRGRNNSYYPVILLSALIASFFFSSQGRHRFRLMEISILHSHRRCGYDRFQYQHGPG